MTNNNTDIPITSGIAINTNKVNTNEPSNNHVNTGINQYVLEARVVDTYSDVPNFQLSENMIKTYSLSKTVMLFAVIDICFDLINMINNFYFIFSLIFSIYGYIGAKRLSIGYTSIYLFNIVAILLIRTYALIMIMLSKTLFNYDNSESNTTLQYVDLGFLIIGMSINIWMIHIIYSYIKYLKKLTDIEIIELCNFKNIKYHYIFW